MKVYFQLHGQELKREFILEKDKSLTLGRSDQCEIQVNDELVSSHHCQLILNSLGVEIIDLNSKNGTYLNNIRVDQAFIYIGDEIKIGQSKIIFFTEEMDKNILELLRYKGDPRDRDYKNLKLNLNFQKAYPQGSVKITPETTRPTKKNKVRNNTKKDIRDRNQVRSLFATLIDWGLLMALLSIPFIFINSLTRVHPDLLGQHRLSILIAIEALIFLVYYKFNFKKNSFSLGEKLTGIKKMTQED